LDGGADEGAPGLRAEAATDLDGHQLDVFC